MLQPWLVYSGGVGMIKSFGGFRNKVVQRGQRSLQIEDGLRFEVFQTSTSSSPPSQLGGASEVPWGGTDSRRLQRYHRFYFRVSEGKKALNQMGERDTDRGNHVSEKNRQISHDSVEMLGFLSANLKNWTQRDEEKKPRLGRNTQ